MMYNFFFFFSWVYNEFLGTGGYRSWTGKRLSCSKPHQAIQVDMWSFVTSSWCLKKTTSQRKWRIIVWYLDFYQFVQQQVSDCRDRRRPFLPIRVEQAYWTGQFNLSCFQALPIVQFSVTFVVSSFTFYHGVVCDLILRPKILHPLIQLPLKFCPLPPKVKPS